MGNSAYLATHILETPVVTKTKVYEEINFERRPTAGDLAAAGPAGVAQAIFILGRITDAPAAVIQALDGYDLLQCQEVLNGFLTSGPAKKTEIGD